MRKGLLAAAVGAAMFIGAGAASAQVLLYSFETGDSPNGKDGFVNNGLAPSQTTTGATVGSDALQLSTAVGGYEGSYTQGDLPSVLNSPNLVGFLVDVTADPNFTANGGTSSLLGMGFFVFNAGEGEYGDQYISPEADWANIDLPAGTYTNLFIPLAGNNPDTGLPDSWSDMVSEGWAVGGFNIANQSNVNPTTGAPTTFEVDNIRAVVPEPASLSLIGLSGGLLLVRRRRKMKI